MKWKYPENYLQSIEKWERIVKWLSGKDTTQNVYGHCGFCYESVGESIKNSGLVHITSHCNNCPLGGRYCNEMREGFEQTPFWTVAEFAGPWPHISKPDALKAARTILRAIKRFAPDA